MQSKKEFRAIGTSPAISAYQVIEQITESDDPNNLRKHLRSLMDSYFLQQEYDMEYSKGSVYSSFLIIDDALRMVEDISNAISERRAS